MLPGYRALLLSMLMVGLISHRRRLLAWAWARET